jgi:hypothetical protein
MALPPECLRFSTLDCVGKVAAQFLLWRSVYAAGKHKVGQAQKQVAQPPTAGGANCQRPR